MEEVSEEEGGRIEVTLYPPPSLLSSLYDDFVPSPFLDFNNRVSHHPNSPRPGSLTNYKTFLLILYGGTFFFANFGPNATTFLLPAEMCFDLIMIVSLYIVIYFNI